MTLPIPAIAELFRIAAGRVDSPVDLDGLRVLLSYDPPLVELGRFSVPLLTELGKVVVEQLTFALEEMARDDD